MPRGSVDAARSKHPVREARLVRLGALDHVVTEVHNEPLVAKHEASLAAGNQVTPIRVFRRRDGRYALVDGNHRLTAMRRALPRDARIAVEVVTNVLPQAPKRFRWRGRWVDVA